MIRDCDDAEQIQYCLGYHTKLQGIISRLCATGNESLIVKTVSWYNSLLYPKWTELTESRIRNCFQSFVHLTKLTVYILQRIIQVPLLLFLIFQHDSIFCIRTQCWNFIFKLEFLNSILHRIHCYFHTAFLLILLPGCEYRFHQRWKQYFFVYFKLRFHWNHFFSQYDRIFGQNSWTSTLIAVLKSILHFTCGVTFVFLKSCFTLRARRNWLIGCLSLETNISLTIFAHQFLQLTVFFF